MGDTVFVTTFTGRRRHFPGPAGVTFCGGGACEQGDLLASGERVTQAFIDALPLCRMCSARGPDHD